MSEKIKKAKRGEKRETGFKFSQTQRGEIYWVKFDKKSVGTEIRKPRPAVIVSNDWQNEVSKRVIVLPFSTKIEKVYYPIELLIKSGKIMCDQLDDCDSQTSH